jgi:hypothetical protein
VLAEVSTTSQPEGSGVKAITNSEIDSWPDPVPSALTEVDYRGCRFIRGEPSPIRPGMFCGKPKALGSSYCPAHTEIVQTEPAKRRAVPKRR